MKLDEIALFHVRLPLKHPFETSFARITHHEAIVVRVVSGSVEGYGEAPVWSGPWYSAEDVHTAWHVIHDHLAPAALRADLEHPSALGDRFHFVRGHPMAKAAIEGAAWDCLGKRDNRSLASLFGGARTAIPSGISLGIESDLDVLLGRVRAAIEAGYQRVKIKIKPGSDVEPLRRVRAAFPSLALMADANAAYVLDDAPRLAQLDELKLTMIEQPLAEDDLVEHAQLAKRIRTPICLDESISSVTHAKHAIDSGACAIVNVKQARVGGASRAIELHDLCRSRGIDVWCGGLLETGIGRLHNVALASLPGFTLPGDVSASERYYEEDLIAPPVTMSRDGMIAVPRAPGIGHSVDTVRLERSSLRRANVR
jgi:o-succinylbenzoate synthase